MNDHSELKGITPDAPRPVMLTDRNVVQYVPGLNIEVVEVGYGKPGEGRLARVVSWEQPLSTWGHALVCYVEDGRYEVVLLGMIREYRGDLTPEQMQKLAGSPLHRPSYVVTPQPGTPMSPEQRRMVGPESDQFSSVEEAVKWGWDLDKYLKDRYPGGMDWLAYSRMNQSPNT